MGTTFRIRAGKRMCLAISLLGALALPAAAHADEDGKGDAKGDKGDAKKDCSPGSWFCGDTQPPASGKDLQPLPPAESAQESHTAPAQQAPVVVSPQASGREPRDAPPAYTYVPRPPPRRKSEWGLNLHLGGAMLGKGRDNNAGIGLAGFGLRYRPIPYAAIEGALDFAGGRDALGFRRNETALTFNGLVFVNPKSVVQLYFLGGFGWAGAHVIDDRSGPVDQEYGYGYFGMQAGGGLEFRLARAVAFNVDVRGFVRDRIDGNRDSRPEFVDSSGRSTNTSAGGLIQGGLTFYW